MKRLLACCLSLALAGCSGKDATKPTSSPSAPSADHTGGTPPAGGIPRVIDQETALNQLRQIGLAYQNFYSAMSKAPKTIEDLEPFYEKAPALTKALRDGTYQFAWGIGIPQMTEGTSTTILACEKAADRNGRRAVVYADGHAEMLSEADFKTKPKAAPTLGQ